jgi:TolB-like protein
MGTAHGGIVAQSDEPRRSLGGELSSVLEALARPPAAGVDAAWGRGRQPGDRIGRYEVLREIGRGGFGIVYEALDTELGRKVALKMLRPLRSAHATSPEWLRREAEAAARLDHPGIVTLLDAGISDLGPWLAMELLHGETLEKRLERGALDPREAVRIALEVARALGHAHAHGVVHQDLKPGNVFLAEDGRVKLLDLGLAHLLGTRPAASGGTPAYMAPEQARGETADARADVFALGALLFEMLTGRPPFPVVDGRSAVLDRASPGDLPAGLPSAVARLVLRCLERDPARRFASGQAVAEALLEARARRPVRRLRAMGLALSAVLVLAVATVAAVRLVGSRNAGGASSGHRPVTLAVVPLLNLSGDTGQEYLSDGMTEEIIGKLSRLRGLAVTARTSVARYKGSPKSAREIGAELGVAWLVEGSVRRAGDRIRVSATLVRAADEVRVWSEDIDATLDDVFAVQERVASRIVDALDVEISPEETRRLANWGTRNAAAYDAYLKGVALSDQFYMREKLEASRTHYERALAIDPAFAPALAGLAFVEAQIYRSFQADPARLERADALVARALAIDPRLPEARMAAGEIRGMRFDYEGGAQELRTATQDDPRNYRAWDELCWALGYITPPRSQEAERACRRAIELSPSYPEAYYHLARVLAQQGRVPEAEQAVAYLSEQRPGANPIVANAKFWIFLSSGRPREALAALSDEKPHPLVLAWRTMALARLGEVDQALDTLEEALRTGYRDAADLRRSPHYQSLRRDPRFEKLLAAHQIPR